MNHSSYIKAKQQLTYKQQLVEKVTRKILQYDDEYIKWMYRNRELYLYNLKLANELREIRKYVQATKAREFVPTRHPSGRFLSIKLSLNQFGITL